MELTLPRIRSFACFGKLSGSPKPLSLGATIIDLNPTAVQTDKLAMEAVAVNPSELAARFARSRRLHPKDLWRVCDRREGGGTENRQSAAGIVWDRHATSPREQHHQPTKCL